MIRNLFKILLFCISVLAITNTGLGWALTPDQVVVVANKDARNSVELAKYYMKVRNIPSDNLIKIRAPADEICSREDYDKDIASPIRTFLKKYDPMGDRFRCLVTMYGIPLRVLPPRLTAEERKQLLELQSRRELIIGKIKKQEPQQNNEELKSLREEEAQLKKEIDHAEKSFQGASVDSELALVREDHYSLEGWLPNKYFLGYRNQKIEGMPENVILVSRLDGPSEKIVRRIIDDSIQVEKEGLRGKAYFDARWPDPGEKEVKDYAFYDRAIHKAAKLLATSNKMPAIIDSQERLFQPGECPDAALYCGWYSYGQYVDAFSWVKGAVGYHIASAECTTLRSKGSQVWCKVMLEKGVAATLGPVSEPYVHAFPLPDVFFGLLVEGKLTLAECYALSNPFWSWQMVLIGDPLYSPFKNGKVKGAG
jgi:uncharacterized protein (TIGR03790 family)